MDLATVIGTVIGIILVLAVMMMSGSLIMYWDFMSLLIVIGGALCSSMVRWPLQNFIGGVQVSLKAVINSVDDPEELIEKIIDLANKARKESILALEKEVIDNEFLAKGVKLAVDGTDQQMIEAIMNEEIRAQKKRLNDGRGIIDDLAESSPAFGMIGTVIGLIVIMANLADPSKIGPGLAVALITTLYGSLFANMFFIPIGKKLKFRVGEELLNFEIIKIGVIGIVTGANPNLMREQLGTYLNK